MKPHPSTRTSWSIGAPDVSAHRILSDILAFIGHEDPSRHRILAAGDLNMIYGATGNTLALREKAFWDRVAALGLEFLGPQAPDGRHGSRSGDQECDPPICRPEIEGPISLSAEMGRFHASRARGWSRPAGG